MAITYNQAIIGDIEPEIIEFYKELMAASTEQDSVYIKAKETLTQILNDANITGDQKATILAQTIASMVNGITAESLRAAIDIAKDKRDAPYALTKIKEDTRAVTAQVDRMENEAAKVKADTDLAVMAGWKTQGDLLRDYGIDTSTINTSIVMVPNNVVSETGTKVENTKMVQASRYNTYASSYRSNGYVSIPLNPDGTLASGVTGDTNGLVTAQTGVAIRQEQGFDDNMRQHVANSSASMISLLLSTEAANIDYTPYLDSWLNSTKYLNVTKSATAGSILNGTPPASISIAAGVTLIGTTANIPAGSSVVVKIANATDSTSDVVAIVQIDGTWSANFTNTVLNGTPVGTYEIIASVMDSTGTTRIDTDTTTLVA